MGFQSKAEDDYEKGKYKKKKVDFMQRIFEFFPVRHIQEAYFALIIK